MKSKSTVSYLMNPNDQAILESCVDAFMLQDIVPIETLLKYCIYKGTPTTEEELWRILWCVSNLSLSWIPKYNALRWTGETFRDKSWTWEVKSLNVFR